MSIQYTFTQHGTIQIECGDDWIEVRLPGSGGGGAKPDPVVGGPVVSPQPIPEPEPPTGPGVMYVIATGDKPHDTGDLFAGDVRGLEHWYLSDFERLDFSGVQRHIRQRMAGVRMGQVGEITVLDVDVGRLSPDSSDALTNLQKLLREGDLGIDALRLWQNDRSD